MIRIKAVKITYALMTLKRIITGRRVVRFS